MSSRRAEAGDAGEVFGPASGREPDQVEYIPRNPGGRPPHAPSDAVRRQVEMHAAGLVPQEDIAALVGVSKSTLQKYYMEDWERGKARASRRVARSLNRLLEADSEKTVLHLAKVVLGLRETREVRHELSGPGGGPLSVEHYARMSLDELRRRRAELIAAARD